MRRKSKKQPLHVTSFRLPVHIKEFLKGKATASDRTMSWILCDYFERIIAYETEQAKQPKIKK